MSTVEKSLERLNAKVVLSALWVFAILNYLYCDLLGVMDSKILKELLSGEANGIHMTEGFLLGSAVLMEIPIAMTLLSRILPFRPNRWANMIAGTAMTVVQIGSLFVGTATTYYLFFSTLEIACTAFIVFYAWNMKAQVTEAK